MSEVELKTRYYTARWRYGSTPKGSRYLAGRWRELRDAMTACLKAGVPV